MKTTKRILSIVLALLLGLTLLVPSLAEDESDVWNETLQETDEPLLTPTLAADEPDDLPDPPSPPVFYEPNITVVPVIPDSLLVGEKFVAEIEAELPDGVDGVLSYAWYDYAWSPTGENPGAPIATGQTLEWSFAREKFKKTSTRIITVVATNTYTDENGETQTAHTVWSQTIEVTFETPWWYYAILIALIPILAVFGLFLISGGFALLLPAGLLLGWFLNMFGII